VLLAPRSALCEGRSPSHTAPDPGPTPGSFLPTYVPPMPNSQSLRPVPLVPLNATPELNYRFNVGGSLSAFDEASAGRSGDVDGEKHPPNECSADVEEVETSAEWSDGSGGRRSACRTESRGAGRAVLKKTEKENRTVLARMGCHCVRGRTLSGGLRAASPSRRPKVRSRRLST